MGRFTHNRGIVELASACANMTTAMPNALLLMVVDFRHRDLVPSEMVYLLQTHPQVRTAGFVVEPAPYYFLMDVLEFPSYREGFSNVPLEATAASVPTVGFCSAGVVDVVVDGETGLLVEAGDNDALAAALQKILTNYSLRERLGKAACQRVVEDFSQQFLWEEWAKFYSRRLESFGKEQMISQSERIDASAADGLTDLLSGVESGRNRLS